MHAHARVPHANPTPGGGHHPSHPACSWPCRGVLRIAVLVNEVGQADIDSKLLNLKQVSRRAGVAAPANMRQHEPELLMALRLLVLLHTLVTAALGFAALGLYI